MMKRSRCLTSGCEVDGKTTGTLTVRETVMSRGRTASSGLLAAIVLAFMIASDARAQAPNLAGRIAAGGNHTLAVMANGTVKAWGSNAYGQLGLGNTATQFSPQMIPGLTGVVALAASSNHSLALLGDGSVKEWGGGSSAPQTIPGLAGVVALAAGTNHFLALNGDGMVRAWGDNSISQLGLGNTANQSTPQTIPSLTGVIALAVGDNRSFALIGDGSVKAWGSGFDGRLGLGNTANQSTPQTIPGLVGVVAIAAGPCHSFALLGDGSAAAWGSNSSGQLGLGNTAPQYTPVSIPGLTGVLALAAGEFHSIAVRGDGSVKAWGYGNSGQLGLGATTTQPTPQTIPGLSGVSALLAGTEYCLALLGDGGLRAWGANGYGQLGLGDNTNRYLPQSVPELTLAGLFLATNSICAIGSTCCWAVNGALLTTAPGSLYWFDVCTTGSSPGIALPGVGVLPLNPPLLQLTYGQALAPLSSSFVGLLDATGQASPALTVPHIPALIGTTLSGAAITMNPTSSLQVSALTHVATTTELVVPVGTPSMVLPDTVPHFGGTAITIIGNGFFPGTTVMMGGAPAANVAVLDQWTIACTAPAHTVGTGNVVVTNPGAAAGTWGGQFTWLAPVINAVSPNAGPAQGGTVLSIAGANFHTNAAVMIGYTTSTAVTFVNSGLITCTAPPHIPGTPTTVWVSVTNPGGVSAFAPAAFTYN